MLQPKVFRCSFVIVRRNQAKRTKMKTITKKQLLEILDGMSDETPVLMMTETSEEPFELREENFIFSREGIVIDLTA